MKSTERHELATNELAGALERWKSKVKPFVSYILIGVVVIVAAIFYMANQSRQHERLLSEATLGLLPAERASYTAGQEASKAEAISRDIRALEEYLKKYSGSSLAPLARLSLANRYYDRALANWAESKEPSLVEADLVAAEKIYQELAGHEGRIGLEAQFGRACVIAERGNKPEAEGLFKGLLAKSDLEPDLVKRVNERLDMIKNSKPLLFAADSGQPAAGALGAMPILPAASAGTAAPATSAAAPPTEQKK